MKTIKDMPEHSRPREKLREKGASALTDEELVAAILGMGTAGVDVRTIARQVANLIREHKVGVTLDHLQAIPGVGLAKAGQILSVFELARRHLLKDTVKTIADRAAAVIFAHNHPSGELQPSDVDLRMHEQLTEAGKILGLRVLDHVIVTRKGHYSFQEAGLIR